MSQQIPTTTLKKEPPLTTWAMTSTGRRLERLQQWVSRLAAYGLHISVKHHRSYMAHQSGGLNFVGVDSMSIAADVSCTRSTVVGFGVAFCGSGVLMWRLCGPLNSRMFFHGEPTAD